MGASQALGTMIGARPRRALLLLAVMLVLLLFGLVAYRLLHSEGRPQLAVATNPISLYVVKDGKLDQRRSGVKPAWSPDGMQLAYLGDHDGNLWVDDRALSVGVGTDGSVQWTPDGGSLLFEGDGVRLLDVETGAQRLVVPGTLPSLSPDGRTVAYLRYTRQQRTGYASVVGSTLQVTRLAGGRPRVLARTVGGLHFESRPQWLPDGTGVTVARRVPAGAIGAWAVDLIPLGGRRRVLVPRIGGDGPFPSFALSPDGRLIAYQPPNGRKTMVVDRLGGRGGRVYEVGKLLPRRYSSLPEYGGLTWSPDGEEVAFYLSGNDQSFHPVLGVYALNIRTGEIRQVAEIPDADRAQLAWNPHP